MVTLFFGADHAGFRLKAHLKHSLAGEYEIIDCGATELAAHDDYPQFAALVCQQVLHHNGRGILICDTGIGMSIAANRFAGIRAALVTSDFMAERTRLHNNTNVLCLGEALFGHEENEAFVRRWLQTDFSLDGRHSRRLNALEHLPDMLV